MRFAQYLEDNQTPEWKKAYIDYVGLKNRIDDIRREREKAGLNTPGGTRPVGPPSGDQVYARISLECDDPEPDTKLGSIAEEGFQSPWSPLPHEKHEQTAFQPNDTSLKPSSTFVRKPVRKATFLDRTTTLLRQKTSLKRGLDYAGGRLMKMRKGTVFGDDITSKSTPLAPMALDKLFPLLEPLERQFFNDLDTQREKVETFYRAREKDMQTRGQQLRDQVNELADHRKAYEAAQSSVAKAFSGAYRASVNFFQGSSDDKPSLPQNLKNEKSEKSDEEGSETASLMSKSSRRKSGLVDPDDYQEAKKKIKKALLEYYRGVELLQNYRILNLTGFRKALKKFEKVTKIPAQYAYMAERVDCGPLGSGSPINQMLQEVEVLYAQRFENGDKKRAVKRLRGGNQAKSHHSSVFRAGLALGFAVPAVLSGLYQSFHPSTRDEIPGYQALLIVYGVFLVPVLFSLLIGINMMVWWTSRINYQFIFALNTRTRLDYRQYFELPAILLATLCYAFWLSFNVVSYAHLDPTIWPLVWLGFVALVMFNPLPVLHRPSRYWIIKNISCLMISGTRHVEFADFWLGDQLCSITYTLSNLYFVGCMYTNGFDAEWERCSKYDYWGVIVALAALPSAIRVVQSIRRWYDSKVTAHLLNGAKYCCAVVSIALYYHWRYKGSPRSGVAFIVWCAVQAFSSSFSTVWDFHMDWSVFKPNAKYFWLRNELIYNDSVRMYYFAIVTNLLLRFAWVMHIPRAGLPGPSRTFLIAILEILRRWQWNFYRLENEHIGNADQYRAIREVPLPYHFVDDTKVDDDNK